LAHHLSARLVHVSSEQAFDGTRSSPYKVTDLTSPINLYGRQKIASERIVRALARDGSRARRLALVARAHRGLTDSSTGERRPTPSH
jgi:dTDP-4-dehydrorhamnose reductase